MATLLWDRYFDTIKAFSILESLLPCPTFLVFFLPKGNRNSTPTPYTGWDWAFPHHKDHCGLLKRIFNSLGKYHYVCFLSVCLSLHTCICTEIKYLKNPSHEKGCLCIHICSLISRHLPLLQRSRESITNNNIFLCYGEKTAQKKRWGPNIYNKRIQWFFFFSCQNINWSKKKCLPPEIFVR